MMRSCLIPVFAAAMLAVMHRPVFAGYPMITDLANQQIMVNTSTPVVSFTVSDDTTPASDLSVTYISNQTDLVPQSDDNVIIGGYGSTRTVQVIPLPNKIGLAIITLVVTDNDNESNQDSFEVDVIRPSQ